MNDFERKYDLMWENSFIDEQVEINCSREIMAKYLLWAGSNTVAKCDLFASNVYAKPNADYWQITIVKVADYVSHDGQSIWEKAYKYGKELVCTLLDSDHGNSSDRMDCCGELPIRVVLH